VCSTNQGVLSHLRKGAFILQLILFFVASSVAEKGTTASPCPSSLIVCCRVIPLVGLVFLALKTRVLGIQGGFAALGCGITFIAARQIGSICLSVTAWPCRKQSG